MRLDIDNKSFSNFSSIFITLQYNAIASNFRFQALRNLLPSQLSYPPCKIYDENNDLLLTGEIVTYTYNTSATPALITLQGYSKPGILEDINIPPSLYPLQTNNLSLKQIIDRIFPTFGIEYVVNNAVSDDFNKTLTKSNTNVSSSIKEYINSLASQSGIIMTHDEKGRIVFTRVNTDILIPAATFEEGNEGIIGITLSVDGQALHSEITVMKQASTLDQSSGQETVYNPIVKKFRPSVRVSSSGSVFDLKKAARMELSRELSTIKFIVETKKFVKPGNLVQLKAPSININNFLELFVEQTVISSNVSGNVYTCFCVLPQVYNFKDVKDIFS